MMACQRVAGMARRRSWALSGCRLSFQTGGGCYDRRCSGDLAGDFLEPVGDALNFRVSLLVVEREIVGEMAKVPKKMGLQVFELVIVDATGQRAGERVYPGVNVRLAAPGHAGNLNRRCRNAQEL